MGPDEVSQERDLLGTNVLQMGKKKKGKKKKKDFTGVHMFCLRHGTCALTHRSISGPGRPKKDYKMACEMSNGISTGRKLSDVFSHSLIYDRKRC